MTVQELELIVFDENMDPVGRIRNAESFAFTENWYEPHTWELKIDAAKISLYQLMTEIQTQHHIGFLSDDGTVKIGIIEDVLKPSGASGEQWTISGRGILAVLDRRKLMNGYSAGIIDFGKPVTAFPFSDNYGRAQQFIPTTAGLTQVGIDLKKVGSPTGTLTVTIRTDSSDYPSGTILATDTLDVSTLTTAYLEYLFDVPCTLTPGTKYWVVMMGETAWDADNDINNGAISISSDYYRARYNGSWSYHDKSYHHSCRLYVTSGCDAVPGVSYETAMRHYVDGNAGPNAKGASGAADAHRVITGLSLAAVDYLRGGACNFQGRAQSLLDTLVEFNKSSQLSCDLVWSGAAAAPAARYTFVFTVYASTDLSDEVILTADLGNVLSYDYQESVLGYRNTIYAAGTGDAAARVLQSVYSGAEPTGRDRFEDYIDATDCSTADQLTQRGNETLTLKAGTESLEFVFDTENQSEVYGVDFKCGDIVTVIDPDVATLVDRITSVTTTYDENGKTITLGMGTSAPDLVSILKMDRKQNTGVRR